MKLAKYRSKPAAQKYADDLMHHYSTITCTVVQHPYDFGWAVLVTQIGKPVAYAAKRTPLLQWRGLK